MEGYGSPANADSMIPECTAILCGEVGGLSTLCNYSSEVGTFVKRFHQTLGTCWCGMTEKEEISCWQQGWCGLPPVLEEGREGWGW